MIAARLSAAYFLGFAFIGIFAPYFALYLHETGSSAGDIAILLAVMPLMRMLGPYLWGGLADNGLSPGKTVALTAFGSLCGLSAFVGADSFAARLLTMSLLCLFWSGTLPLLETLTFGHLADRSSRYGAIRLWGSLGFVGAVLIGGQLIERHSIAIVPWICWLILLALLPISLALPAGGQQAMRNGTAWSSFSMTSPQPAPFALLGSGFLMAAAHGAFNVFYSIHLAQHGYGGLEISILWALGVVAEILALLSMPRLARLAPPAILLMACFAAAGVRFALVGWCTASAPLAVFAQTLHALSFAVHHAVSVSAINRCSTGGKQGRVQALYASCHGAGTLLGGLASGMLWPALGSAWTFGVSSLLACAGLGVIALFMRDARS